jgi:hypothetical protein
LIALVPVDLLEGDEQRLDGVQLQVEAQAEGAQVRVRQAGPVETRNLGIHEISES